MSDNNKQDKSLVTTVQGTVLAPYQDRELVKELVGRLMAFHPAAPDVGERGMLAAAQLAIMLGASPLPGTNEIHIWKDEYGGGKLVVMPGQNYWMRRAEQKGGVYWDVEARPMTDKEEEIYGVPQGSRGAICRAVRVDVLSTWSQRNMPIDKIVQGFGRTGVGMVSMATYQAKDGLKHKEGKQGRPVLWTAQKRAEKDVLSKLFPYIPGEKLMEPGVGMRLRDDGTGYEPDYNQEWGQLDWSLDDAANEERPERGSSPPEGREEVENNLNRDLFGNQAGYGSPVIIEQPKAKRQAPPPPANFEESSEEPEGVEPAVIVEGQDDDEPLVPMTYQGKEWLVPKSIYDEGPEAVTVYLQAEFGADDDTEE